MENIRFHRNKGLRIVNDYGRKWYIKEIEFKSKYLAYKKRISGPIKNWEAYNMKFKFNRKITLMTHFTSSTNQVLEILRGRSKYLNKKSLLPKLGNFKQHLANMIGILEMVFDRLQFH